MYNYGLQKTTVSLCMRAPMRKGHVKTWDEYVAISLYYKVFHSIVTDHFACKIFPQTHSL